MACNYWIPTTDIIQAIFDSYSYDRSEYHMIMLLKEIRARIENNAEVNWTDDGDIIYGILVILYGDYGTSPRGGWIIKQYKENILSCIDDIIKESEANI